MIVSDYTALLSGVKWNQTGPGDHTIVTYTLNTTPEAHWSAAGSAEFVNSFQSAKRVESVVQEAFRIWEEAANIQFVQLDGNDAAINIGLFDFSTDPALRDFAGFAYYPDFSASTTNLGGDIFISIGDENDLGLWLHEIGHAIGLEHSFDGARILETSLDTTSQTLMSYTGPLLTQLGPLDRQAITEMYPGGVIPNLFVSEYEVLSGPKSQIFQQLRDYDGNKLGAEGDWKLTGKADVQLDADDELIFINPTLGRWATVGLQSDGFIDYGKHGEGGDTRVVGVYLDPLVESGMVERGSDIDSARRLENDFKIDNLKHVGALDVDRDGFQNLYFKTADGTAYLNALMHADGNVRYANYQSEAEMIDYLTSNGWDSGVYNDWLNA